MTSATLKRKDREGGTRGPRDRGCESRGCFPLVPGSPGPCSPGFTLIELLLSLAVLMLLIGVATFGLAGGARYHYLDEGASRYETLLRLARAEAANRGRALRLEFAEDGACRVTWEPGPLEEPGVFLPYTGSGWARELPNEIVRVVSCRVDEAEAYRPPEETMMRSNVSAGRQVVLQPIVFRADGSCDSAVIELRSTDIGDGRRAIIEVDGVNALFTTRMLMASEVEARDAK